MARRGSSISCGFGLLMIMFVCWFSLSPLWSGPLQSGAAENSVPLPEPATRNVDFVKEIQPLFAKHCYRCHGSDKQQAGLRLDLKDAALHGGDGGKIFEPGKSGESRLVLNIAGTDPKATD